MIIFIVIYINIIFLTFRYFVIGFNKLKLNNKILLKLTNKNIPVINISVSYYNIIVSHKYINFPYDMKYTLLTKINQPEIIFLFISFLITYNMKLILQSIIFIIYILPILWVLFLVNVKFCMNIISIIIIV